MLTHERVRELLCFDPATGVLTWAVDIPDPFGRAKYHKHKGAIATHNSHKGKYLSLKIDGESYLAHRLAWFFMTREWPTIKIDHENRNGLDNTWDNLRSATNAQNMWNKTTFKPRKGEFPYVSEYRPGRFRYRVVTNGVKSTGSKFSTAREAYEAALKVISRDRGEFATA